MLKDKETKELNAARIYARNKLTKRQRRFVDLYHRTGEAEQSAVAAGYEPASAGVRASEMLADTKIQLMLHDLARGVIGDPEEPTDRNYVLSGLRWIADNSMRRGRYASALRALELIGKSLQMFQEAKSPNENLVEGLAERLAEARARLENPPRLQEGDIDGDPTKLN